MKTSQDSATGYTHLTCTQLGLGAAEQLYEVCSQLVDSPQAEISGTVFTVFNRTMSIEIDIESEHSGPAVLTLAVPSVRPGPLITRVSVSDRFSFRRSGHGENTDCRFRLLESAQDGVLQLRVGRELIIDIPTPIIQNSITTPNQSVVSQDTFSYESTRYGTHCQLLEWIRKQAVVDGLDRLSQLHAICDRAGPPDVASQDIREELTLLQPFVSCLSDTGDRNMDDVVDTSSSEETSMDVCSLLGYGPGSTPSGDDFLVGIILILRRIDCSEVQSHLSNIGNGLVTISQTKTTRLSAAFLSQAVAGRGAKPTADCVDLLIAQSPEWAELTESVERVLEIGSTSGSDILAGMLTATTFLLPVVNNRTTYSELNNS